jgi:signal transduction histidine kinase
MMTCQDVYGKRGTPCAVSASEPRLSNRDGERSQRGRSKAGADDEESCGGQTLRVLLVEDNPGDADLVRAALERADASAHITHVERISEALAFAVRGCFEVVLLDLSLPDSLELQGVRRFHAEVPDLPIVVLTSLADERLAAAALAEGAQDYLVKGEVEGPVLLRAMRYAMERQQHARERALRLAAELARNRALLLSQVSKALFASFDWRAALSTVAQLVVPELGDACAIDAAERGGSAVRLVATSHRDSSKGEWARQLWESDPGDVGTPARRIARVLRTGEGELHRQVTDDVLVEWARDAEHLRRMRVMALQSALVVPIEVRGQVLGALTLVSWERDRRYGPEDLALALDVGQRAGITIENARLYEEARRAVGVRDEFLSIASHELRNPLTALHLQLESVRDRTAATAPQVARKLESAIHSSHRIATLIETLLDVSRITSGRFSVTRERFDAAAAVRNVVERFHDAANLVGCEVTFSADASVLGEWDRVRFEQAVTNLLSNALKYAAGKPVEVGVSNESGRLIVTVSDEGPGIPEADLPRIFEKFERASSTRHHSGLGLGLYITRLIAESHGGDLEAANLPTGGARFTLRLPVQGPPRS